ncbi:glycosyltransferase involved in cell wall biosynthesis [Rhodoferax ferrireducens]|uniref:Glycosyltransferase involved in cell wall biosynthesis n=1 Tax=Rhodoferax ferrireducens TaxID=192843 RepID=A0ABU2C4P3_9BURK|nr:glycosyltransferase family 2 protein [Rhodoferax ferrireducens]MDR7376276.1 glycosyltransferase involved in cell wall biosynthesis [Rhodoferax ferrireducens]
MKPSVSVALCTHNGARFILDQVNSIGQQSVLPAQIVVSDDASSDHCVEIAQAAIAELQSQSDLQLQILRNNPPLKVVKNFEQAVSACTGDLIALCDQDDAWHPDRLERMVAEFERRPDLLLLHSNARLIDAQGADLSESLFDAIEVQPFELAWIHGGRAIDTLLRRNVVTGATTVFRRSLLQYALPFPPEWLHDEWLAMVAAAVGRVDVLEDRLIDYRQHAANQVGARRETLLAKMQKALSTRDHTLAARAVRVEVLLDRLLQFGDAVPPETIEKVRKKLAHQRFRASLPQRRMARWLPVVGELVTGRYNQFGRGLHCVARDLLESGGG